MLEGLREAGVGKVINVSASVEGMESSLALAGKYPFIYAAVGVHPDGVGEMDGKVIARMHSLARDPKTVAIGEIGLDYYWDKENHEVQKKWFREQLGVAREEKLPFIIHSREAAADTLELMKEERAGEIGGVIHCFSYGVEMAREYLNMGLFLGVGGVLTFKNARKLKEVVEYAPLSSCLLYTSMVLVNLKPAKLAGVLSEGMILCAEDAEGNLALMTPEKPMPAGAEIC